MDHIQKTAGTITKDGDKAMERVQDVAETAWERGLGTWNDLSAQGKQAMAGAQKSAEDVWEDAQKLVQKHPGKSVGIALLVGAVVGVLLAFRKSE